MATSQVENLAYQTPLEREMLGYIMPRIMRDEPGVDDFFNPDSCPYTLLKYLAAEYGADLYTEVLGEAYARKSVKSASTINAYRWAALAFERLTSDLQCIATRTNVMSGGKIVRYNLQIIPLVYPAETTAQREYYTRAYQAILDLPTTVTITGDIFIASLGVHAVGERMCVQAISE